MRYLKIAVFLFCFQIALAIVNYADQYQANEVKTADEWLDEVDPEEVKETSFFQNLFGEGIADAVATITGYVKGLWLFVKVVGGGVIWFPETLKRFGLDSTIANFIALPVYLIYIVGVVQFLSGRQAEAMS